MMVKIGLYWQHDLDLVALYMHPDFELAKWMKLMVLYLSDHSIIHDEKFQEKYGNLIRKATGEYQNVAKEGFYIPLPSSVPYHLNLTDCSAHFYLNPSNEKDKKAINYLLGFRYGSRTNGLKVLFRFFLNGAYMEPYFNEVMFSSLSRRRRKTTNHTQKVAASKKRVKAPAKKNIDIKNTSTSSFPPEDNFIDKQINIEASLPKKTTVSVNNDSIPNTPSVPLQEEENTDGNRTFNKEIKESELQESTLDASAEEIEELDDSGFDMFGAVNELMGGGF